RRQPCTPRLRCSSRGRSPSWQLQPRPICATSSGGRCPAGRPMRAMTCPQFDAGGRHRSVTENTAHGGLNEALADIRLRGVSTAHSPEPRDRDRGPSGAVTETRQTAPDKPERPSVLQMTASALTAVSATALLSFVGVWGTVLGMGLLSILTVLGNYMYSSFIHRTAEKVKEVGP